MNNLVPCGKHKDKKWSDVPKSYLEFMVNLIDSNSELQELCGSELEKRTSKLTELRILPSAIDTASFCVMDDWKYAIREKGYTGGFYTYVTVLSKRVLEFGESDNDGNVFWKSIKLRVQFGRLYPTVIKVSKTK